MTKKIDFDGLLRDLFQEDMPVREKMQECPQPKKNVADFSKALGEIFSDKGIAITACEDTKEANILSLQACNLYAFMREIVMEYFGMGYDYAFTDKNGTPLKSWFTIPEVIETAKSQGYRLTVTEARTYLDRLIKRGYIETDNYKYRRCALWDKRMEEYLLRHSI